MKRMFKIYCLIDPRDKKPFYVGVTIKELKFRLSVHISTKCKRVNPFSIEIKRRQKIDSILADGFKPQIHLLEETTYERVDKSEKAHYKRLISNGYDLLQNKSFFRYSTTKKHSTLLKNGSRRNIMIAISKTTYKKLLSLALRSNTSISHEGRNILETFFKTSK